MTKFQIITLFLQHVQLCWVIITGIISIISGIIGFYIGIYKFNKEFNLKLQQESNSISNHLYEAYQQYMSSLSIYMNKIKNEDQIKFDDFIDISINGENYFNQLRNICDSIISKNLEKNSINNTYLPKIKDVIEKDLIQTHYATLTSIASQSQLTYNGQFLIENYQSIFSVYAKFVEKV